MAMGFTDSRVMHTFTGSGLPHGAAITYNVFNGTLMSPAALATNMEALWETNLKAVMASTVTAQSVIVKNGPSATGPSAEVAAGWAGTNPSAVASAQVSILVRKNSAQGGRTGRGRFYMPGVSEPGVDPAGVLDPSYRQDWQNAFDDILAAMELADTPMQLAFQDGSEAILVTSLEVDSRVATQRRRLRR